MMIHLLILFCGYVFVILFLLVACMFLVDLCILKWKGEGL